VPGARMTGGVLEANTPITGLKIQVRAGIGPWRIYKGPVATRGPVALRTLSPDGRRVGRTTSIRP
jgi:hexosaminidase